MNKTVEMAQMLGSRNLYKSPFKSNAKHHSWAQALPESREIQFDS